MSDVTVASGDIFEIARCACYWPRQAHVRLVPLLYVRGVYALLYSTRGEPYPRLTDSRARSHQIEVGGHLLVPFTAATTDTTLPRISHRQQCRQRAIPHELRPLLRGVASPLAFE